MKKFMQPFLWAFVLFISFTACGQGNSSQKVKAVANGNPIAEANKKSKMVLVDFTAVWCGPCKRLAPVLEEIGRDYKGKLEVVKVDVDQYRELASEYAIESIPTVILFKNGKPSMRMEGLMPKEHYTNEIEKLL